jgi:hypothetical protein
MRGLRRMKGGGCGYRDDSKRNVVVTHPVELSDKCFIIGACT